MYQSAWLVARFLFAEQQPGNDLPVHDLEKLKTMTRFLAGSSLTSLSEFIGNVQQLESRLCLPDRVSACVRKYIGSYAYSMSLYVAFTLVLSASSEIKYAHRGSSRTRMSLTAKKFCWTCFVYIRARVLKDDQLIFPTISLMLAVVSVLSQPYDSVSTIRTLFASTKLETVLTKITGTHAFPDRAGVERAVPLVQGVLDDLVACKVLSMGGLATHPADVAQSLVEEEVAAKNLEVFCGSIV